MFELNDLRRRQPCDLRTLRSPTSRTTTPHASMKSLPPVLREKAIEIANALLEEGMDEGKAIRIAIARAKRWARSHLSES
jgi:uncharacterized protein YdaT